MRSVPFSRVRIVSAFFPRQNLPAWSVTAQLGEWTKCCLGAFGPDGISRGGEGV